VNEAKTKNGSSRPIAADRDSLMEGLKMHRVGRVAQSVYQLATGWTVRGSNPGRGKIFRTCPDRPLSLPSLLYDGYRVFPGVESGRA
jgi:hypothetical protein